MQGLDNPAMKRSSSQSGLAHPSLGMVALATVLIQGCTGRAPATVPPPSKAAAPAERTIPLAGGGRVTVERTTSLGDEGETVVVFDRNDQQVSRSWCADDAGSYDRLVALFTQVQKAVKANDRPAVARLVRFPLKVNEGKSLTIENSAAFLKQYERIFSASVTRALAEADPHDVFCRWDGAMFGNGVVWANSLNGRLAIEVVNR